MPLPESKPMPKRNESHMQGRRDQIMDALHDCIRKKGITDTSITDVAKRAKLSIGAIYIHFTSKEEILIATVRRSNARLKDAMAELGNPEDLWQVIDNVLGNCEKSRTVAGGYSNLELMMVAQHNSKLRREIEAYLDAWRAFFRIGVAALPGAKAPESKAKVDTVTAAIAGLMMDSNLRSLIGIEIGSEAKRDAIRLLVQAAFPQAAKRSLPKRAANAVPAAAIG
jgi:AcrR family transcriptional regulator